MKNLKTMRADINLDNLPVKLRIALSQYDKMRQEDFGIEKAEAVFQVHRDKLTEMGRLCRGLHAMPIRSLRNLCTRYTDLCGTYVSQHTGDLKTLQGLFYWNGSDKLTERILLSAWRYGK